MSLGALMEVSWQVHGFSFSTDTLRKKILVWL